MELVALPATLLKMPVAALIRCTTLLFPPEMYTLLDGSIANSSGFHMLPCSLGSPSPESFAAKFNAHWQILPAGWPGQVLAPGVSTTWRTSFLYWSVIKTLAELS